MAFLTVSEARSSMFAKFFNDVTPAANTELGYTWPIVWGMAPLVGQDADKTRHWARITTKTVVDQQKAFMAETSAIKYTTHGLIFVQFFGPLNDNNSEIQMLQLAERTRNAFRGNSPDIWYRHARIQELEPEAKWLRCNVVVEYEFDNINP